MTCLDYSLRIKRAAKKREFSSTEVILSIFSDVIWGTADKYRVR